MSHPATDVEVLSQEPEALDPATKAQPGFAARLRAATKDVHREAERTGFIADLIRGRATHAGYGLFLRNLVPVYAVLEGCLGKVQTRGDQLLSVFAAPELQRLPRLIADLEAVAGSDWHGALPVLPEAEAYARAIEAAAGGDGTRLAAHAYARYLGDLSGGQILKPLLSRTLKLTPAALGFYDFPAIADLNVTKQAISDALDRLGRAVADSDAIVDEAIAAFRHNIGLSLAVSRALAEH